MVSPYIESRVESRIESRIVINAFMRQWQIWIWGRDNYRNPLPVEETRLELGVDHNYLGRHEAVDRAS